MHRIYVHNISDGLALRLGLGPRLPLSYSFICLRMETSMLWSRFDRLGRPPKLTLIRYWYNLGIYSYSTA